MSDINRYQNISKYLYPNYYSISHILDNVDIDILLEIYNKYYLDFYISDDKNEF